MARTRSLRGPLITIRCDCGGVGYAAHGASWSCPACGRCWDTGQIPADEFWALMRQMRWQRVRVMVTALALMLPVLVAMPFAGPRVLILAPVLMSFWFLFYMPRWRRRTRELARGMQHWQLKAK